MIRTSCAAIAAAMALVWAAPASALRTQEAVAVRTNDIDITTERGARRMLQRLERAADVACGGSLARVYPSLRPRYRACHESAVAMAVQRLRTQALWDAFSRS